jgi:hypothetical protein
MKKSFLTATALIIGVASIAKAEYCDLEKSTINSLKGQLNVIESQLNDAKVNRNASAVNAIGSLITIATLTKGSFGLDSGSFKLIAGTATAMTALNGYNIYLRQQDVSFYQDLSESVKKMLAEKDAQIQNGTCVSEIVKKSSNEKAKDILKNLIVINSKLQSDVQNLEKEIGSNSNLSKVVNVGASIILVAGTGLLQIQSQGPAMIGMGLSIIGTALNTGSQAIALPSLIMTAKEAKAILAQIKSEQNKLAAQELLMREVLSNGK